MVLATLIVLVSRDSGTSVVADGIWSVEMGGGRNGLIGPGLGIRGDMIETRPGSLIKLLNDLGDSKRMLASRFRSRFGD